MAENSSISWTDHTFNPWVGCTKVSPACDGCYAENLMAHRYRRVKWGAPGRGEGTRARTSAANWKAPLTWNRKAEREATRPFVFCASLADVFDNAVPADWRRDLFDLIRATPNLTWLLLTKRPGNILKLFADTLATTVDKRDAALRAAWPRNAAIGCTVVTQDEADRDVRKLLEAKGALDPAFAFVSMEPLLEAISLGCISWSSNRGFVDALTGATEFPEVAARPHAAPPAPKLDWVITGGETDQGVHRARPAHPDWFRSLRDQCARAGVPFHFKQWGEWQPGACVTRQRGVVETATAEQGGDWWFHQEDLADTDGHVDDEPDLYRVGKRGDPCTLDGVRHLARPEPA